MCFSLYILEHNLCAIYASIHPYGDVDKLIAWPADRRVNIDVSTQILERDLKAVNVELGDVYLHIWHIAFLLRLFLFAPTKHTISSSFAPLAGSFALPLRCCPPQKYQPREHDRDAYGARA